MIKAVIFDLDGTLVQTERLKAVSYAQAAVELCPYALAEESVIEAFKEVVGRSRREVAEALVAQFDLTEAAALRMEEFGVATPWQAYVQLRLRYYQQLVADPQVLQENRWSHTVDLLKLVRQTGCQTALATMSHCEQVNHVLAALGLEKSFDFVATRDDVERGKPHPEIYRLVAGMLSVPPDACLVIEDSPAGVAAALAAGMACVAIATPFTRRGLQESGLLAKQWIVDNPADLLPAVNQMMEEKGGTL